MARFLLDSHVFLWAKEVPEKIDAAALPALQAPDNALFVSIAALRELSIKAANGKLPFYARIIAAGSGALLRSLRELNIGLLPFELSHTLAAAALPQHHRDPFDRMMIGQAISENLTLVTSERIFAL